MKKHIAIDNSARTPCLEKFWFLSYEPKQIAGFFEV